MTANVCRQCSADTTLHLLGRVEGEEHGIHVAIEGLPTVTCTSGHTRFPSVDFPLKFIEGVLQSSALDGVVPSNEKGLFRKRLHCPSCGKELGSEPGSRHTGSAKVQVSDSGEPVAVELAVPIYTCPGCGKASSLQKSAVERGVMSAVANAFKSADIPPG